MKEAFYNYIESLQDKITLTLEAVDGASKFKEDVWQRKEGAVVAAAFYKMEVFLKKAVLIFLKYMAVYQRQCKLILRLGKSIFLLVV